MDLIDLEWTFVQEVKIPKDILELLVDGEQAHTAYKTVRDVAVFTNKRILIRDSQGVTGTKKEVFSLPYKSVIMWSTENSGIMDFNSEVQLWTRAGNIKINLKKGVDVRAFDRLIAEECM